MDPFSEAPVVIEFRRFRVLLRRRELLADGRPVQLGGRAFDLLMALIEASGAVVSKDALMERVWLNRIVDESSIHVQISALRNAFGADRDLIRTVAGRGYQFAGEIRAPPGGPDGRRIPDAPAAVPAPPTNLPASASELIGRDAELAEVAALVAIHRLVTLTGVGGIGKTRLGLEVARRLLAEFPDGIWLAEFGPLSDPDLVPVTVAAALGLRLPAGAVLPQLVANALGSKRIVLVFDNCEHVVDAAAQLAETLLRANPTARVIATSREPLRAEGEWIYPTPPLAAPTEGGADDEDPLRYDAVRLFVERARSAQPHFAPDKRVAAAIADICRRLDGIPLAIELAASCAAALGVEELATHLHDYFAWFSGARRTALPRHKTLRATFDWSHDLLAEAERMTLRRLAIFAGAFKLEAAIAVAASDDIAASDVVRCLTSLVAKSLVISDVGDMTARYRLLNTTRAYALEKLAESGESETVARRHAGFHRDLLDRAEAEWGRRSRAELLEAYGRRIDEVRTALDWAFSTRGDASLGIALTASAAPLWMELSLMEECRIRVECALASLRLGASADTRREMQLHAALGAALFHTRGPGPEVCAAWTDALAIAERLGDAEYRLRALWGLWVYRIINAECRAALALGQRFCGLSADHADASVPLVGERMLGTSLFFLGDHSNARRHLEHLLSRYSDPMRASHLVRFQLDLPVSARATLSPVLWLQGFPDQAMRLAEDNIEDACAIDHAPSLCNALANTGMVALAIGDLEAAERAVAMLREFSARHALGLWRGSGHGYEGWLLIKRGDVMAGIRCLRAGLDDLRDNKFVLSRQALLGALAQGLASVGQVTEGLAAIDEALAQCRRTDELWDIAELLRVRGELLVQHGAPGAAIAAEDHFLQALDWARRQGALWWELGGATSLARLWRERRRAQQARELLAPVYDRFTEGFSTADLRAARALIDELS